MPEYYQYFRHYQNIGLDEFGQKFSGHIIFVNAVAGRLVSQQQFNSLFLEISIPTNSQGQKGLLQLLYKCDRIGLIRWK